MKLNVDQLRQDTPGTQAVTHFNNAGSSLPVKRVVDIITEYLQLEATLGGYETKARYQAHIDEFYNRAARLINCDPDEIAILGNASEAFNKALYSIRFQQGDIILTSEVEYGNNYINFLKIKEVKGIEIQIVPNDKFGNIMLEELENMISPKVRLFAFTHVPTNSGLVIDAEAIGKIAKRHNILYLLDACQSVGQLPVDVEKIGCDFLSATSRKYLRGPRGLGFLYVKKSTLKNLSPPSLDMVTTHWQDANSYTLDLNVKMFENWEKSYALILGFSEAIDYLNNLGVEKTWERIQFLANNLREKLSQIEDVEVLDIGTQKCGIVSFKVEGVTPEDIVNVLLQQNINISASMKSSTLLDMDKRGLSGVNRASVHYYNTIEEIDLLVGKIKLIAQYEST